MGNYSLHFLEYDGNTNYEVDCPPSSITSVVFLRVMQALEAIGPEHINIVTGPVTIQGE